MCRFRHFNPIMVTLCVVAFVTLIACGSDETEEDPDNTGEPTDDAGVGDEDDVENGALLDHTTVWETLDTTYDCSNEYCHGGSAAPDIMDYQDVYDVASECDGSLLVDPGNPEGSLLWQKISPTVDDGDVCGDKMPGPAGVSDEHAQMVYDWIDAGANELR